MAKFILSWLNGLIYRPKWAYCCPNFEKQGHFSMCSRTMNWPVGSNKLSTWHMSVKGDAVHINNNTKSHTRCGYTVTGKIRNTIKEARHTVIPGNTLNSNSKWMSRFYRKPHCTIFKANNRTQSTWCLIVCSMTEELSWINRVDKK